MILTSGLSCCDIPVNQPFCFHLLRLHLSVSGGHFMIFHIAVCAEDPSLRTALQRRCEDYFARRADACLVEPLDSPEALLARDAEKARYQLYLIELSGQPGGTLPAGLSAAMELRRRGRHTPLAF